MAGIMVDRVLKPRIDGQSSDCQPPSVIQLLARREIDLVFAFPRSPGSHTPELLCDYKICRCAVDFNVPIITNFQVAQLLVDSLAKVKKVDCRSYQEFRDPAL
jgi:hypothetical protein